jgi:hypothetical protein
LISSISKSNTVLGGAALHLVVHIRQQHTPNLLLAETQHKRGAKFSEDDGGPFMF